MKEKPMKKIIAAVLILFIAFSLGACSREVPEDVVTTFFQGLEAKDKDVLDRYVNNADINALLNSKGNPDDLNRLYTCLFKNLSYEIVSVKADKEKATVKVEVANTNFKKVKAAYDKKSFDYMINNLYTKKINKAKLNEKCLDIFVDQVEHTSKGKANRKKEVVLELKANDYRSWDLTLSDELMDAVMGGLVLPF